ncbi:MerR family transcriptional regulator [Bartonella sp. HY329]|uniref:MerR family transcriptional regulator n=1 Tax=unclassified Bartonella TaxID=2645622 RepID=UPI0021C97890|nr:MULTISPECIES: MerR family transcriptional regulator [unclassified Bartonella]UXM94369.1 MerR family transcriptional regulator [Bartonella sp. HY329]UXN08692.1 MerR family transcriptional regulator [Bartonella sp. HY328]
MIREFYTIKDLTKEFNITPRTLRYYEDEGLIQPIRQGRMRLYSQLDHNRITAILRARRLNFSLEEIQQLLHINDHPSQDGQTLRHILDHINTQRQKLKQMRQDINDQLDELERLEDRSFERLAELGVMR